jgi:hypothetical protein
MAGAGKQDCAWFGEDALEAAIRSTSAQNGQQNVKI